jgi:uncharacterized protein (TIGR00369 family)
MAFSHRAKTALAHGGSANSAADRRLWLREMAELSSQAEIADAVDIRIGTSHARGVLAALVDHVLGAVCYPVIPRGAWAATTEFKINYLAPVREGTLEARAEITTLGRRTAVVRIEAHANGDLVGIAQGTVTIRSPTPPTG